MASASLLLSLTRRVSTVTPGKVFPGGLGLPGACSCLADDDGLVELVSTDAYVRGEEYPVEPLVELPTDTAGVAGTCAAAASWASVLAASTIVVDCLVTSLSWVLIDDSFSTKCLVSVLSSSKGFRRSLAVED
jgi:hypothetical protein